MAIAEKQEISRSAFTSEDIIRASFYESLNSRTISSIDISQDLTHWNFISKKRNLERFRKYKTYEYAETISSKNESLSNQNDVLKIKLPIYFGENKNKILSIFNEIKFKNKFDLGQIEKHFNVLTDNISELKFNDIYLEITKSNLIKFTTLFGEDKILVISKDFTIDNNDVIYSYFINSQMIATDVFEISSFFKKFKEYISL